LEIIQGLRAPANIFGVCIHSRSIKSFHTRCKIETDHHRRATATRKVCLRLSDPVGSCQDRRRLRQGELAGRTTLIGDSKSTSGYVVMLTGAPIAWSSRRQATVATSSTHSEHIGQANVIKQACHLIQFLGEVYRFPNLPLRIYADNQSA